MHPDDLESIWVCHRCREKFVFYSDVEYHVRTTDHAEISKHDFQSGNIIADA
jgi:hypothetical protein